MGNEPTKEDKSSPLTKPHSNPSSPPSTLKKNNFVSKSKRYLFSGKDKDGSTTRPLSPGKPKSIGSPSQTADDPHIDNSELEALKDSCLSIIEHLILCIEMRPAEEDAEITFQNLKDGIVSARKRLSKYNTHVVNKIERPASAKVIQDNFDWDNLGLDSIDAVPLPDDIDIATLSPPNSGNGNEQSGTESPNDSDDYGLGSIHSSLLRYRNSEGTNRSSSSGDPDSGVDPMSLPIANNSSSSELVIDYIASITLDADHYLNKGKNSNNNNSNNNNKNEKNESKMEEQKRNILDDVDGIQKPYVIIDNICIFLTVSERFTFGTCNKVLYENIGTSGYSFEKSFQMDNIYWAQHFDQYFHENNDSVEIWDGRFHKFTQNELVQLKYFLIFYHNFTNSRKISNFKAIIPSDLETLVISGNGKAKRMIT